MTAGRCLLIVPNLNQGAEAIRAFPTGGSRFTYTATVDARVQKGFSLGRSRVELLLDVYNLLDRANEVEERVVSGPGYRITTAVQPPRAVHFGARLTL